MPALIPSAPAGLASADEVYYSTAELTAAAYDGSTLKFHFNTPGDGEIALRLSRHPQAVRLDGELVRVTEDAEHLLRVKIPKGHSPEYERTLAIEYLSAEPRIVFQGKADGIAGEPQTVRMMIQNPRRSPFSGDLVLRTGRLQTAGPLLSKHTASIQPGG